MRGPVPGNSRWTTVSAPAFGGLPSGRTKTVPAGRSRVVTASPTSLASRRREPDRTVQCAPPVGVSAGRDRGQAALETVPHHQGARREPRVSGQHRAFPRSEGPPGHLVRREGNGRLGTRALPRRSRHGDLAHDLVLAPLVAAGVRRKEQEAPRREGLQPGVVPLLSDPDVDRRREDQVGPVHGDRVRRQPRIRAEAEQRHRRAAGVGEVPQDHGPLRKAELLPLPVGWVTVLDPGDAAPAAGRLASKTSRRRFIWREPSPPPIPSQPRATLAPPVAVVRRVAPRAIASRWGRAAS